MTQQLNYFIFNTNIGWMGLLSSPKGLRRITLPQSSVHKAHQLLGNNANYAIYSPHPFNDLTKCLRTYFNGHETTFPGKLDLSQATTFQRKVLETTRLIPYGKTRSYSWVAEQIKKPQAVRAVGQALARNPLLIIVPCHRVVASNGKLGGFSGGIEMKRHLLQLEATTRMG